LSGGMGDDGPARGGELPRTRPANGDGIRGARLRFSRGALMNSERLGRDVVADGAGGAELLGATMAPTGAAALSGNGGRGVVTRELGSASGCEAAARGRASKRAALERFEWAGRGRSESKEWRVTASVGRALGKRELLISLGGAAAVSATKRSEAAATKMGSAGKGAESAGHDRPATRGKDGALSVNGELGKPELPRYRTAATEESETAGAKLKSAVGCERAGG
jgi:hypothetical protein